MPNVFVVSSPCLASGRSSSLMKSSWMGARFRTGVPTSCLTSVASPTMSMSDIWYETVSPGERLTQGDIIFDCPLVSWSSTPIQVTGSGSEVEALKQGRVAFQADVIVMTQACDLEQEKVRNVVACPHLSLSDYQAAWDAFLRQRNQNPTAKAWRTHCSDIKDGYAWNLSILNRSSVTGLEFEHRIVDFHEVFTLPREFLESLLAARGRERPRLLSPYREHLSQAFARYFMRVGLPVPVDVAW
jgi:hypothetical protein